MTRIYSILAALFMVLALISCGGGNNPINPGQGENVLSGLDDNPASQDSIDSDDGGNSGTLLDSGSDDGSGSDDDEDGTDDDEDGTDDDDSGSGDDDEADDDEDGTDDDDGGTGDDDEADDDDSEDDTEDDDSGDDDGSDQG